MGRGDWTVCEKLKIYFSVRFWKSGDLKGVSQINYLVKTKLIRSFMDGPNKSL